MLARVADSLYWMGKYIERTEHMARYLNVNYFSSLDASHPISKDRTFVMESTLFMLGLDEEDKSESNVLYKSTLDPTSKVSILTTLSNARENARGSMDLISTEVWEAINKYYHFVKGYPKENLLRSNLDVFTTQVMEQCNIIKGKITGTLLHDKVYSFVLLGIHMERAIQIARIISTKLNDVNKILSSDTEIKNVSYEWTTLLKCTESFDMLKRHYKRFPDKKRTLEFLILNNQHPRSISFCLSKIKESLDTLGIQKNPSKDSVNYYVGKIASEYWYMSIDEIEDSLSLFIVKTVETLNEISKKLADQYFQY